MTESTSTGFETIERLLQEGQATGTSPTLAAWVNAARQRLAKFRQSNPPARSVAEAVKIEQAYDAAAELINGILAGTITPQKPPR